MTQNIPAIKSGMHWYTIVPPLEGWDRISRVVCGRDAQLHPVAMTYGISTLHLPKYAVENGQMLGWYEHELLSFERRKGHSFDFNLEAIANLSTLMWRGEQRWGVDFVAFARGAVFIDLMQEDLVMAQRLYDLADTREAA
jgi:hypothetical protein